MADVREGQITLERLARQIEELQARVTSIEKFLRQEENLPAEPMPQALPVAGAAGGILVPDTASLVPILGVSFLGLAVAYLFRALSEMNVIPIAAGIALGVSYALGWLFYASRTSASDGPHTAIRSLTSVLILVPLLWEAQVRFKAVPTWLTAGILVGFVAWGLGLSWRRNLSSIAWIASLGGLLTASALLIATKDLLPFTWVLLALAIAVECSACFQHLLHERWVVAILADLAILLMTYVVSRPGGIPAGYAPMGTGAVLASQIALLIIYLASTMVRTLWRDYRITGFEVTQCVAAFVISTWGALQVAKGDTTAVVGIGSFCALAAIACYWVSSTFLKRHHEADRNFYVYATFGLLLVVTASWLLLDGLLRVLMLCLLAVAFVRTGRKTGRMTLKWHGTAYLLLAVGLAGLLPDAFARYFSSSPHSVSAAPGLQAWSVALAALLAYGLLPRSEDTRSWNMLALAFVLGAVATVGLASSFGGALLSFCPNARAAAAFPDFCATLLTLILTGGALFLTRLAARWQRPELPWIAYLLIGMATGKLLIQDLRQTQTFSIVLSLLLYGGALILLPRMIQRIKLGSAAAASSGSGANA